MDYLTPHSLRFYWSINKQSRFPCTNATDFNHSYIRSFVECGLMSVFFYQDISTMSGFSLVVGYAQSPIKKRPRRSLSVTEKEAIISIYTTRLESLPHESMTERVSFVSRASGTSISSVYRIVAEYKSGKGLSSPKQYPPRKRILDQVSQETKASIRRKIHEFIARNGHTPTLDKMLSLINDDEDLPNFKRSTLSTLLKQPYFRADSTPTIAEVNVQETVQQTFSHDDFSDPNSSGKTVPPQASTSKVTSRNKSNAQKCVENPERKKINNAPKNSAREVEKPKTVERPKIEKQIVLRQKTTDQSQRASAKSSTSEVEVSQQCKKSRERKKLDEVNVPKNGGQRSDKCCDGNQLEAIQKTTHQNPKKSYEKPIELQHEDYKQSESTDVDISKSGYFYCRLCFIRVPPWHKYIPLCLHDPASEQMKLMKTMVQALIPDLDLTLSFNPIICSNCQTHVTNAYSFISKCQKNNNILKTYREQNPDEHFVDIETVTKTRVLKRSASTKSTPIPSKKPCTGAEEKHPQETVEEPIRLSEIKIEVKDFEDDLVIEENKLLDIKTEVTERDIAETMLEGVEGTNSSHYWNENNSTTIYLPSGGRIKTEMEESKSDCDVTETKLYDSELTVLPLDPQQVSKIKSETDGNFSDSCQASDTGTEPVVKSEINEILPP